MSDADYMQQAIAVARQGIQSGQTPFGAVIVRGDEVVCAAHNTVRATTDPTAHAEVNAIRQAAARLHNIHLDDCTMYTTCEPCPMCLAAIHWTRIARVVFGATIEDAANAGFNELGIPAVEMVWRGGSKLVVDFNVCEKECAALFDEWQKAGLSQPY